MAYPLQSICIRGCYRQIDMKIGILYEGDYDQQPFSILLNRIATMINDSVELAFELDAANGTISSKVESALKLFFEVDQPCDAAVFINDMDAKNDRCRGIKACVRQYMQKNPLAEIFVLCPSPAFEQWFFIEENALRKVLNLPADIQVPYSALHPKSRLEKLIYEYNEDFTRSKMEIYKELAEVISIDALMTRDREFKNFCNAFVKKIPKKD
jgi:hypothetical protein